MQRKIMLLLPVIILVVASLACNLPVVSDPAEPIRLDANVVRVKVIALNSPGKFKAQVTYDPYKGGETVHCQYGTKTFSFITEPKNNGATHEFEFEETTPQTVQMKCYTTISTAYSNEFTVSPADNAANPPDSSDRLNHGFLNLDVPHASSPNILGGGCWPPQYPNAAKGYLTVDADGTLEGKCTFDGAGDNDAYGELSGKIDSQAGTVIFHLKVTYVLVASNGKGRVTENYTVDGNGTLTPMGAGEVTGGSGAIAKGSATFTWTCAADSKEIVCGGKPPDYELTGEGTGTVPFTMTFYSEGGH